MEEFNTIPPSHRELIQSLIDGTLNPVEAQRVNALLRGDAVLREFYIRQIRVDEQLQAHFEKPSPLAVLSHPKDHVSKKKYYTAIAASVAAGVAAAIVLLFVIGDKGTEEVDQSGYSQFVPAPDRSPVARVSGVEDVVWAESSGDIRPGHWLSAGKLEIKKGMIELNYASGSTVLIKAPATYYIEAQNKGFLEKGSIRAHSPETVASFFIGTPNSELVDLGTTFGVTVLDVVATEVHVIEGLVKARALSDVNGKWRELRQGSALRISSEDPVDAEYDSIKANLSFYDWTPPKHVKRSESLEYVHWSFDRMQGDQFPETGVHSGDYQHHAAVVDFSKNRHSYRWLTPGRFGDALKLDGKERFLRTDYPAIGGNQPRTIAFWVRLDHRDARHEALPGIVSWGQNGIRGAKWQVLPFQPLLGGKKKVFRTECAWGHSMGSTDINDGRWHHVVSVFTGGHDADVATHVKHYVDGKLETSNSVISRRVDTVTTKNPDKNFPLVIGVTMQRPMAKSLEDMIALRSRGKVRLETFNGCIDELYVFNGALTPQEILQLMKKNAPPSEK